MIIDIDNSESVQPFVKKITKDWFDIDTLYAEIKAESVTNSPKFWGETDYFMDVVATHLNQTPMEFLRIFEHKCSIHDAKIMGYHCTRHSDKNAFLEKVYNAQTQELKDKSGSCAIVVLLIQDMCYVANVGDSRAVLSCNQGQKVYPLSLDHKPGDDSET